MFLLDSSSVTGMVPSQYCLRTEKFNEAHHMLHRTWKRIRFCLCRIGMIMRKTAIRRQRKNTMVWRIMPVGERAEPQGLIALQNVQHPTNLHSTPTLTSQGREECCPQETSWTQFETHSFIKSDVNQVWLERALPTTIFSFAYLMCSIVFNWKNKPNGKQNIRLSSIAEAIK